MKIGRQAHKHTAISTSNAAAIVVRGHDLCSELIGHVSFTHHIWLLITGQMPTAAQRRLLDATLVAIAEHGLVPSVQVSRMTLAAAPEALHGAVAAGVLGCGSVILGASADAGRFLDEVVQQARGSSLDTAVREVVGAYRAERRAIPGYGHPEHKSADPRALRLLEIASELEVSAQYVEASLAVERLMLPLTGKALALNVSGAIPAVLLDAGFPVGALRGIPILARTASLIAHLVEEQARPIGFVLSHAAAQAIDYDGPVPKGFGDPE